MCTAVIDRHLFGRTLDLECSYGETVTLTPGRFPLRFLREKTSAPHRAILGTACVRDGTPLYYDALNESGLAMAGLNFPGYAVYHSKKEGAYHLASFELIPWLLGQCDSLAEARELLGKVNVLPDSFRPDLPATSLHWLIADQTGAIVVESVEEGLRLYDNPVGVLTNSPSFPYHMTHLRDFLALGPSTPENRLCPDQDLSVYSRGMGGMGLPGDWSSASRFARAVFARFHTLHESDGAETERFFRVMDTVSVPKGCILTDDGQAVYTVYTCCADLEAKTYSFTTYAHRAPRRVSLSDLPLDGTDLFTIAME